MTYLLVGSIARQIVQDFYIKGFCRGNCTSIRIQKKTTPKGGGKNLSQNLNLAYFGWISCLSV